MPESFNYDKDKEKPSSTPVTHIILNTSILDLTFTT